MDKYINPVTGMAWVVVDGIKQVGTIEEVMRFKDGQAVDKYVRPITGTVWIMVTDDEDLQDMNGLLCLVTDFDGREGSNGDDDVTTLYINGTKFPQKERRFVGRHKYIGTVEEVGKFIHEKFGSNTEAINNYLLGYVFITGCRIKCWHTTATHLVFYVGEEEYRRPLAKIEGYKTK